jgi:FkbM family methyltransferase
MNTLAVNIGLKLLSLIGHLEWVRFGIRYRIIIFFCNSSDTDSHEFEVDFFGSIYKGNLNNYIDWNVYFFGAYEKFELFMLRDLIKEKFKPVFIDIGANIGHHSLFMSRYCDKVHAYEPYEPVRKQLDLKIQRNNIQNIHVHKVGLGQTDCELDFFAPTSDNTGTGSFISTHDINNNKFFGKLQIVNADNHIAKLHLDHIDLIKMDVEGFEKNVLLGMNETLKKYRPILFMEFSGDTQHSFYGEEEIMSLLPIDYCVKLVEVNKPIGTFFNQPATRYKSFNFNVAGGNIIFFPLEATMDFEF